MTQALRDALEHPPEDVRRANVVASWMATLDRETREMTESALRNVDQWPTHTLWRTLKGGGLRCSASTFERYRERFIEESAS